MVRGADPPAVVHWLPDVTASLLVERGFSGVGASLLAGPGLTVGARAQSSCGTWDLPKPGIEPVSPALGGRFLTPGPPGKSRRPEVSYPELM